MYVQVRLYAAHDYDLLAYSTLKYMPLDNIIHECVCAYVRQEEISIPEPSIKDFNIERADSRICVTFNDNEDADVIEFLNNIKYGYLNSALKLITRSYLSNNFLYDLFTVGEDKAETPKKRKPAKKRQPIRRNVREITEPVDIPSQTPVDVNNIPSIEPANMPLNNPQIPNQVPNMKKGNVSVNIGQNSNTGNQTTFHPQIPAPIQIPVQETPIQGASQFDDTFGNTPENKGEDVMDILEGMFDGMNY